MWVFYSTDGGLACCYGLYVRAGSWYCLLVITERVWLYQEVAQRLWNQILARLAPIAGVEPPMVLPPPFQYNCPRCDAHTREESWAVFVCCFCCGAARNQFHANPLLPKVVWNLCGPGFDSAVAFYANDSETSGLNVRLEAGEREGRVAD